MPKSCSLVFVVTDLYYFITLIGLRVSSSIHMCTFENVTLKNAFCAEAY
jgi:hypothetical protein